MAGPRLEIPFEQWGVPLHVNGVAEGGGFTGLSRVVTQTYPGISFGGGVDYYIADNMAVGLFGRWNRIIGGASPNGINNTPWSSTPDNTAARPAPWHSSNQTSFCRNNIRSQTRRTTTRPARTRFVS